MPEIKNITIITTINEITLRGFYRRDLETNNWHYYEREDGTLVHIRKEYMVCVFEEK